MCLVVTCRERAGLLALVCGVELRVCHFPIGILGQMWYLIVSIPDICTLTFFVGPSLAQSKVYINCEFHRVQSPFLSLVC